MAALRFQREGQTSILAEHLVGDMPVLGFGAIALDGAEGYDPQTPEQQAELRHHAALMAGEVVAKEEFSLVD